MTGIPGEVDLDVLAGRDPSSIRLPWDAARTVPVRTAHCGVTFRRNASRARATGPVTACWHAACVMLIHRMQARSASHLRRPKVRGRPSASPVDVGKYAIAIGGVVLVIAGWPMQIGPTLLLGGAVVMWALGNFAMDRPRG